MSVLRGATMRVDHDLLAGLRAEFLAKARDAGCTCEPDIEIYIGEYRGERALEGDVAHDDWCPMCEAPSEYSRVRP